MGKERQGWVWARTGVVALCVALFLAACSGDDDEPEPTATAPSPTEAIVPPSASPSASPAASSAASPQGQPAANVPDGPPRPAATFPPGLALRIDDGICRAQIPFGWVETGGGQGSTISGDRFILFGGNIPDDASWDRAVELVVEQAPEGAEFEEGDRYVLVTFPDDRGFEYRARFGNIYCDFRVTSPDPIPEQQRQDWERIMGSLAPLPQPEEEAA